MYRTFLKAVLCGLLVITGLGITACATTDAKPAALAGDDAHPRHATGIESHVAD